MKPTLLVIESHHLGDAVMTLPVLRAAGRVFDVRVLCRPPVARLLTHALPGARAVPCKGWAEVLRAVPRLGAGDAAVCAWPDTRAHLAMRHSRAEKRVGVRLTAGNFYGVAHAWRKRRLLVGGLVARAASVFGGLLTDPVDRDPVAGVHWQMWERIGHCLGLDADYSVPWMPSGPVPGGFEDFVSRLRGEGRRVFAVHAGARLPTKRWAVENFESLLRGWFVTNRVGVAILHAPGEACPAPQAEGQQVFECAEAAALGGYLTRVDGVLSHDSFAAHVAAAMGVPVVTVFGSGDPAWFAPYANAGRVASSDACPFRPCVDRCVQPSPVCLENLSIHLVEAKLSAMVHDLPERPTI